MLKSFSNLISLPIFRPKRSSDSSELKNSLSILILSLQVFSSLSCLLVMKEYFQQDI